MADAPDAPAEAPKAPESEQTPTSTNEQSAPEQKTEAPDMHGFTSEQLAEMRKFYDANGGFEKVKSKISNPEKPAEEPQPASEKKEEPTSQQQAQPVDQSRKMGWTNDDIAAQYFFESLSKQEKYAPIAKEVANGEVLKEMSKLGIPFKYPDGSWDIDRINDYLDLRAKTVPAKPTESEPNASNAPTVSYTEVGENITSIEQAYKVLMEPGNPGIAKAEEYIKNHFNPNSEKNK